MTDRSNSSLSATLPNNPGPNGAGRLGGLGRAQLARRLVIIVLICSAMLSSGATAIQLYFNFQRHKTESLKAFDVIDQNFRTGLENALWVFNFDQLEALMDGIYGKGDVVWIRLQTIDNRSWERGEQTARTEVITRTFVLSHNAPSGQPIDLGVIAASVSLDTAWDSFWAQIWVLFFSNIVKTGLASVILFVVFHRVIARHLRQIAQQVSEHDWMDSSEVLQLNRTGAYDQDDLGRIVGAINDARSRAQLDFQLLKQEISKREAAQSELATRNQDLLGANLQLERRNRDMSDFVHIASHDLKEPLRSLSNHSAAILEDYEDELDEDGRRRLHRLVTLSQRMGRLISDTLTFARLGKPSDEAVALPISPILNGIILDFADIVEERNAIIRVDDDLPLVEASRTQLDILFRNLIANALTYNRSDQPSISLSFRECVTTPKGNEVGAIAIQDNGIGIDQRFSEDIFRIFRRLHSDSEFSAGTGAGLSFVKKIVESLDGDIWFESTPGHGTTFFVSLPFVRQSQGSRS